MTTDRNLLSDRLLRRREVQLETGLACSTIYAKMADGSFPKPMRIGIRAVAWRASDIANWKENLLPATR